MTSNLSSRRWVSRGVGCVGAMALVWAVNAADTNKPAPPITFPKSTFVHSDASGKDPFFPNRQRGALQVINTNVSSTPIRADTLFFKGFIGPPDKRIALINNLTFVKGEEQEVKVGTAKVKVKVLEFREKSVVIQVEGQLEPKELFLPETNIPFRD